MTDFSPPDRMFFPSAVPRDTLQSENNFSHGEHRPPAVYAVGLSCRVPQIIIVVIGPTSESEIYEPTGLLGSREALSVS